MIKNFHPAASAVGLAICALGLVSAPATAQSPWGELLRNDIEAAYSAIEANHVGPVDAENPAFRELMNQARTEALRRADTVDSWEGYRFAMMGFADRFEDGHMNIFFRVESRRARWPSFIALRQAGRSNIVLNESGDERLDGATITACDGEEIEAVRARVASPFYGVAEIEGAHARAMPYVFLDEGNPFVDYPETCEMRAADGSTFEYELRWARTRPADWNERLEEARGGAADFKFEEYAPGRFWISVPTFMLDEGQVKQVRALIAEIEERHDDIASGEQLVIDIRGNGGGNSFWANQITIALFGEDYLTHRLPRQRHTPVWRLSEENMERVEGFRRYNESIGAERNTRYYANMYEEMQSARENGDILWAENDGSLREEAPTVDNPVRARTVILTDSGCFSSCLNFMDLLTLVEGRIIAGDHTYADAVYMESQNRQLPSRLANLNYTMKVIRNRARGHNQAFAPDWLYTGTDWSEVALRDWIDAQP